LYIDAQRREQLKAMDAEEAAVLVYSEEEEAWDSGLFACFSDLDSFGFCVMSCFCPGIAYGINYDTVAGGGALSPCVLHTVLDVCFMTDAFHSFNVLNVYAPLPPIGCCLRYTHRRVAANGRERPAVSMLKETFCWACSLTQVHKDFLINTEEKKKTIVSSSEVLGTLDLLNGMNQPR
jgi:Cys-rich protein (TIGR01571 family)